MSVASEKAPDRRNHEICDHSDHQNHHDGHNDYHGTDCDRIGVDLRNEALFAKHLKPHQGCDGKVGKD